MKIYIPLFHDDAHEEDNPFVVTFTDVILHSYPETEFKFSAKFLWQKECETFNIIHVMWPHVFSTDMVNGLDFEGRLKELKAKGVKIISTCHNLKSHIEYDQYSSETYKIVYQNSDVIIHLGNYSINLFTEKYSDAKQIIIPHHVYDTLYQTPPSRDICINHLNLRKDNSYILCFGAFRNNTERDMVCLVAKALRKEGYRILAPSIVILPFGRRNPCTWITPLLQWIKCKMYGIVTQGRYISNEELPYYYGASSISFLQRSQILNSGNLPLGFYMGNVVVGPDTGNVGEILRLTSNPTFDPSSMQSIIQAIKNGLELARKGQGQKNHQFAMNNFSTKVIAESHYKLYKSISRKD